MAQACRDKKFRRNQSLCTLCARCQKSCFSKFTFLPGVRPLPAQTGQPYPLPCLAFLISLHSIQVYMSNHCRCYFLCHCCSRCFRSYCSWLTGAFAGTLPLWITLARNLPPMSLLFPVTSVSVNLLWPKLLTLSTALIGALRFWQQIEKPSKLSMPGMCSQKRRRSALIHPPYHPLPTRPTLPFLHIGNIDFYFASCLFWK